MQLLDHFLGYLGGSGWQQLSQTRTQPRLKACCLCLLKDSLLTIRPLPPLLLHRDFCTAQYMRIGDNALKKLRHVAVKQAPAAPLHIYSEVRHTGF